MQVTAFKDEKSQRFFETEEALNSFIEKRQKREALAKARADAREAAKASEASIAALTEGRASMTRLVKERFEFLLKQVKGLKTVKVLDVRCPYWEREKYAPGWHATFEVEFSGPLQAARPEHQMDARMLASGALLSRKLSVKGVTCPSDGDDKHVYIFKTNFYTHDFPLLEARYEQLKDLQRETKEQLEEQALAINAELQKASPAFDELKRQWSEALELEAQALRTAEAHRQAVLKLEEKMEALVAEAAKAEPLLTPEAKLLEELQADLL